VQASRSPVRSVRVLAPFVRDHDAPVTSERIRHGEVRGPGSRFPEPSSTRSGLGLLLSLPVRPHVRGRNLRPFVRAVAGLAGVLAIVRA